VEWRGVFCIFLRVTIAVLLARYAFYCTGIDHLILPYESIKDHPSLKLKTGKMTQGSQLLIHEKHFYALLFSRSIHIQACFGCSLI